MDEWKGFGRKQPWTNRSSVSALALGGGTYENQEKDPAKRGNFPVGIRTPNFEIRVQNVTTASTHSVTETVLNKSVTIN
jgi:hypothetical protein